MDNKLELTEKKVRKKKGRLAETWFRFRKNRSAMIGLVILVCLVLIAIFADVIVPYDNGIKTDGSIRLQSPSIEHLFGTDKFGRDEFARIIHATRVSLSIGLLTSLCSLLGGGLLGAVAGYYGGKIDNFIMRILDIFMCIPFVLLALSIVAALGPSLVNLLIAMTISAVPGKARLVRSVILTISDQDYVEAARSYGARDGRIILKYILPNALGPVIVDTTMGIAGTILGAASLSFIGMGIQPPAPEWGSMLSDARDFISKAPYLLYFPGIAIMLAAMSCNLIGDGLTDALDPKLKD